MAFTPYQLFIVGLMLVSGTFLTISNKWADRQEAHFCNRSSEIKQYEHPFFQALGMFIGDMLCLLVFKFIWYSTAVYRMKKMTYKDDAISSVIVRFWPIQFNKDIHLIEGEQAFNPFGFWIPAILDMIGSCLFTFGLNLITASSVRMLAGSLMVFTAIFSILFLKKKLNFSHWLGIAVVIVGLVAVGASDLLYNKNSEGNHPGTARFLAIIFILLAMLLGSFQVVYEERFISKYNISPLQATGWEGIFGFLTLSLLLIPFHFIHMDTSNTGPDHRLEDIPSAFCQMNDNHIIIVATVGNILSEAFYNFASISITKELSSTTRVVFDNGRTLSIWAVTLALQWEAFHLLQVLGFVLLVIGIGIYNDVWQHLWRLVTAKVRAWRGVHPPITEKSPLLSANA